MNSDGILSRTLEAHGGIDLWRRCRRIEARLSSGGLAFASRWQRKALFDRTIRLDPRARRLSIHPYPLPDFVGIWSPERVEVCDRSGTAISARSDPRGVFGKIAKQVRWDALDMLYFAGYALWNYLSFPYVLAEPGVEVRAIGGEEVVPRCVTLGATFPTGFPTHSRTQRFHLDRESLELCRHDYTADVIGRWARAANVCLNNERIDGLRFYTSRRVYPRLGPSIVLPFPTLVWIELSDLKVERAEYPGEQAARAGGRDED